MAGIALSLIGLLVAYYGFIKMTDYDPDIPPKDLWEMLDRHEAETMGNTWLIVGAAIAAVGIGIVVTKIILQ